MRSRGHLRDPALVGSALLGEQGNDGISESKNEAVRVSPPERSSQP